MLYKIASPEALPPRQISITQSANKHSISHMSRKYEGIVVLNTKGTDGGVEELVSVVSKEMEAEGATIGEVQDLGRRKFAYNSNHMESGHYINYAFSAEPSALEKIKGRLRLNNQVHLQYFQRKA
jgi:small subunit ribosomal protein S6